MKTTVLTERTIKRLQLLMPRLRDYSDKPESIPSDLREEFSMMCRSTFPEFAEFAELGMRFLGFPITEMQIDIAKYMQYGTSKSMVQAQRGEAKSTLAALFAVWSLIQEPSTRCLVVSAGESQASDVALLIIRLIEHWPLLCWLRPDKSKGDRTSFENYDVHYSLRRPDKSASVSCIGITANLPGRRADLLIPDDIESPKNAYTQGMRDTLLNLSKEFTAICTHGRILYLGTPQTKDSVYKSLQGRGFEVRIWPGRYPTNDELDRYCPGTLAPMILNKIEQDGTLQTGGGLDGTRGKPTDLGRYSEEDLVSKELDWGPEGFSLQYMLDTSLSDAMRTKLKLSDLIFAGLSHEAAPEQILYEASAKTKLQDLPGVLKTAQVYGPGYTSAQYTKYTKVCMSIDPAGSGGDEVAFAIGGSCQSYVHLFSVGGLRGGMSEQNIIELFKLADEYDCKEWWIESNMGAGTVTALLKQHAEKCNRHDIAFNDYYVSTQKEKRIIDTLGPLFRRHKLVVHTTAVNDDEKYCKLHPQDRRTVMSAWYQLGSITYDRGSLAHDDRADAIQKVAQELSSMICIDDEKSSAKRNQEAAMEYISNPMGYGTKRDRVQGARARLNTRRG